MIILKISWNNVDWQLKQKQIPLINNLVAQGLSLKINKLSLKIKKIK